MTRQHVRRGFFRSIADLQAAINAYIADHNASPKPFAWTKSAEAIMAKLERCPLPSVLIQCTRFARLLHFSGKQFLLDFLLNWTENFLLQLETLS